METAITTITVLGGMAFSLGVALVVEELIFGKVFPHVFVRATAAAKAGRQN
jgi:hypothetical protein